MCILYIYYITNIMYNQVKYNIFSNLDNLYFERGIENEKTEAVSDNSIVFINAIANGSV